MSVFQQLVNKRLRTVTVKDVIKYSKNYQIPISVEQAKKIVAILRSKQKLNIFNDDERKAVLREIAKQTNVNIARQFNKVFMTFMKK